MDLLCLKPVISVNEINTSCAIKLIDAFYSISVENENVSNVSEPIDYSIYRTPSGKEIYIYINDV